MKKIVCSGAEAKEKLKRGVDLLANAVKSTLGPKGRLVLYGRRQFNESPRPTKDGYTVAGEVNCNDPVEQLGADLIREAAEQTVHKAGDGTTTATLLAQVLIDLGFTQLSAKHSPDDLERGVKYAVARVCERLDAMAIPTENGMLENVALISSNGDSTIAKLVVDAVSKVGKHGVITCEPSRSLDTTLTVTDGMQFPEGFRSPYFQNSTERVECAFDECLVLMHEGRIPSAKSMLNVSTLAKNLGLPLLVVAGDYEPEALAFLVSNKVQNGFRCCAIRASGWGDRRREILHDLAAMAGGKAITDDLGLKLENITQDFLGKVKSIKVTETSTVLVGGFGSADAIAARVADIQKRIDGTEDADQRRLLEQRLSGLTGGVAVIRVGGNTTAEMRERRDRVEDAMFAVKAAADSGVVPGGGLALLLASVGISFSDAGTGEAAGIQMVIDACAAPMSQIAENAGRSGQAVVEKVRDLNTASPQCPYPEAQGYNAATGRFELLIPAGVLDPVKVVREALQNAASVACVVLRTDTVIAEDFTPEVNQ